MPGSTAPARLRPLAKLPQAAAACAQAVSPTPLVPSVAWRGGRECPWREPLLAPRVWNKFLLLEIPLQGELRLVRFVATQESELSRPLLTVA